MCRSKKSGKKKSVRWWCSSKRKRNITIIFCALQRIAGVLVLVSQFVTYSFQ